MATNDYSEYTSLLQGYRRKRKKKKRKVIAAATLTFFKNLADKALTRDTNSKLLGYQSEYESLGKDASSIWANQQNFITDGVTRGGESHYYDKDDEGQDIIKFRNSAAIEDSFIQEEINRGKARLSREYADNRYMDKKYMDSLTKIGTQKYSNWLKSKAGYDWSIKSESEMLEGIRKALLLTKTEFSKPRYGDSIANLGYKIFNKEVHNPAFVKLSEVKGTLESLKSRRNTTLKSLDDIPISEFMGKETRVRKLSLSIGDLTTLKQSIEDGDIPREHRVSDDGIVGEELTISEQIDAINKRYGDKSILPIFGFNNEAQLLAMSLNPKFDPDSEIPNIFGKNASRSEEVKIKDLIKKGTSSLLKDSNVKGLSKSEEAEFSNHIYRTDTDAMEKMLLTKTPKERRDILLKTITLQQNSYKQVYSSVSADNEQLEYRKFNIEMDYLRGLDEENEEYKEAQTGIYHLYGDFLDKTPAERFTIVQKEIGTLVLNWNTGQMISKGQEIVDAMEYLSDKLEEGADKEEWLRKKNIMETQLGADQPPRGIITDFMSIVRMNDVHEVKSWTAKDMPLLRNRPEEWMLDVVDAHLQKHIFDKEEE